MRPGGRYRRRGSASGGFGLVELLIVVLFIGILVRFALPVYHGLALQARAERALEAVDELRLAAFSYNADTGRWPADVSGGVLPPELEPYLDEGFSLEREDFTLDWDHWTLPEGAPGNPEVTLLLGITVATGDRAVGQALVERVGDAIARFTLDGRYTFILAAP